jgi:hypothetical protein
MPRAKVYESQADKQRAYRERMKALRNAEQQRNSTLEKLREEVQKLRTEYREHQKQIGPPDFLWFGGIAGLVALGDNLGQKHREWEKRHFELVDRLCKAEHDYRVERDRNNAN